MSTLRGGGRAGNVTEVQARIGGSVAEMVRMPLQYGERPIQLFEQNRARQFMGNSHFSKRQGEIGMTAGIFGKAIGRANDK